MYQEDHQGLTSHLHPSTAAGSIGASAAGTSSSIQDSPWLSKEASRYRRGRVAPQHYSVYAATADGERNAPPSPSVLAFPPSLLAFDKQSQGKPRRTLPHVSSDSNNVLSAQENRVYAQESDWVSLCSPLTSLSIVGLRGRRRIKA